MRCLSCFLQWRNTCLRHLRTCFTAERFTPSAVSARASHSTGEFSFRRSHCRNVRHQTEGFLSDIQSSVEITVDGQLTRLAHKDAIGKRQVRIYPATPGTGFARGIPPINQLHRATVVLGFADQLALNFTEA